MIRVLLTLLLLLSVTVTWSATPPAFSWSLPTTRVDGSALPSAEIAKSTVKCGTSKGGPYATTKDATGAAATLDAASFIATDGWHYCVLTTTGQGASAGESAPSGELAFFSKAGAVIGNPLVPAAPGGFKVQ